MSCSSPPQLEHDDAGGRMRAPALDLLDEYWFFSNTLVTAKKKEKKPPHLPMSPSTSTSTATGTGDKASSSSAGPPSRLGVRRLLRTPSLPTSRVGMTNKDDGCDNLSLQVGVHVHEDGAGAAASGNQQQPQRRLQAADEVDDDDLNWSSIYEGVLRTRMAEGGSRSSAALRRAPSMPVPSSAMATDRHHGHVRRQTKSTPRLLRHSHSTLGRHTPPTATTTKQQADEQRTPGGQGQRRREVRSSLSASQQTSDGFQLQQDKKKWKSSSDLESIVFEQEELRESMADVLPGLKQQTKNPRRPYLSESWQQVRRPALARVQSAAEMKDQLRMWAQAVACNVRQDC